MALDEGQMVTLAIDEVIETITSLTPMAQKAGKYTPLLQKCSVQVTPSGCL